MNLYYHEEVPLHDLHNSHVAMKKNRIKFIFDTVLNKLTKETPVQVITPKKATRDQMLLVHGKEYLDILENTKYLGEDEHVGFDRETILNSHTWNTLEYSSGAVVQAVTHYKDAMCIGYGGHHAYAHSGGGFCFTNQVAIGAKVALQQGHRVAVLDFDTHSGDGTATILKDLPEVGFFETYQEGYPNSSVSGSNITRYLCDNKSKWRDQWTILLNKVWSFNPTIIIVSAGFDSHEDDPLGVIGLSYEDYGWIGEEIGAFDCSVISVLEGGYNLNATANSVVKYLNGISKNNRVIYPSIKG